MRQGGGGGTVGSLSFLESRVFIPRNRILVRRTTSQVEILRRTLVALLIPSEFGNIVPGVFTPVLAKHSKSFLLSDCISVGVD